MKVIQNFSSKKHVTEFPVVDLLIWYLGLNQLRAFGYDVKLYCEKKDLDFLKSWGLLDLYSEIDDEFMSNNELINDDNLINGENFWSKRKIECINHEFEISAEPFVYMDTDIILNAPLSIDDSVDLFVWSPESQEKIYIPWTHMSIPEGYHMPKYIFNEKDAYNCGILYFKRKNMFAEYRKQYLSYTVNNPCETCGVQAWDITIRNIWACNAEQRILKAVASYRHWRVKMFMDAQAPGACEAGIHYYYFRGFWRLLSVKDFLSDEQRHYWTNLLNFQIDQLLHIMEQYTPDALKRFLEVDWLKDFYENHTPIVEYK